MLPIVLVLLVATSALAFPSVQVTQTSINDVAPPSSNGRLIGGYLIERANENVDGGDTNVYILTVQKVMPDLANQRDTASQAYALAQGLAVLSELAYGYPGDACAAANPINVYVNAVRSGNPGAARGAITNFIQYLIGGIDAVVQLARNPVPLRFAVGPRGNCANGGRIYQFEAAWDTVLASINPGSAGLMNEQYCAAKRLYGAFNARSNNVGAFLTAASLRPVNLIFQRAIQPVARFFAALGGPNADAAAGGAKQALVRAAANVAY